MAAPFLQLIDRTGLFRLGLTGPGAQSWLSSQGVVVPREVYGVAAFGDGGRIVRQGSTAFFAECRREDDAGVSLLAAAETAPSGIYVMEREEASFELSGITKAVLGVLAQTCAIDFRSAAPACVIYTRVAGVSCCILPNSRDGRSSILAWFDPSYAHYLWHELKHIVDEVSSAEPECDSSMVATRRDPVSRPSLTGA